MSIILKKGPEANRSSLSLQPGEVVFTTDTRHLYVGSKSVGTGEELTFNQLTASRVTALDVTVTSMSAQYLNVSGLVQGTSSWSETASYLIGSIESASFSATSSTALYSETASYLSSSGQIVALGDLLVTDTSSNSWTGNQSYTGSGIFIQRNGSIARSTLLSIGSTIDGNGADTIAVAGGSFGSIVATQQGHFGAWQLQTFGGTTWSTSARMLMQAGGDHNEGSRPTDILFQSTPSGSTILQTRLKINGSGVQVTGSLGIDGQVGVGITAPTAYLHIKAGTNAAGTAPIKLSAGAVNDVPESGTIEFDGTDFWLNV